VKTIRVDSSENLHHPLKRYVIDLMNGYSELYFYHWCTDSKIEFSELGFMYVRGGPRFIQPLHCDLVVLLCFLNLVTVNHSYYSISTEMNNFFNLLLSLLIVVQFLHYGQYAQEITLSL
jgi:hypothetical protein